jgi:hypothetical protein
VVVAVGDRKAFMRLTAIIAVVAVSASLVVGCSGPNNSKKSRVAHSQKCEQLGFKRGSLAHANCRLELTRQATPRGGETAEPEQQSSARTDQPLRAAKRKAPAR